MAQKISIPLYEKIKSIPGFFGIRLDENPQHKVLKEERDFEVREYGPLLVARTLSGSTYETSSKKSFMRLAGYIFGGNQTRKIMPMTAPVFIESRLDGWLMTFVLPKEMISESQPKPQDNRIEISTESSKKWAVMNYTGIPNESLMKDMAAKLSSSIKMTNKYRITS